MCAGSSNPCDAGEQCDPNTGMCVTLMQPPVGTPCEADGNLCTLDTCDGLGHCVFDQNVTCPASEPCADFVCDPGTGNCGLSPKPLSTPCEADGNLCTIDHCDGNGNCVPLDVVMCPDAGPCSVNSCNPASGLCEASPRPLSTPCEADDDLCTIDHCDGMGQCVPLSAVDCSDLEDQCNDAVCDPMTGDCDVVPKALSTPCERDGNPCTIDHCDGQGGCVALDFVDCPDGTPPCDAGQACDPASGMCVDLPDPPDGTPCDDPLYCNGAETCRAGVCEPGTPPCDDGDPCTMDSCNEKLDQCVHECPAPEITCPSDRTFECDAIGDFGTPTINDPCGINTVVECVEQSVPGKLPQDQIITRTCTVTNNCGSNSCQQRIDVVDTTPPEITCPPDKTFECDAIGDFGDPIVTDNCDPDPEVNVEVETIIGDCRQVPLVAGISVPPKLTVVRTITATDGSGDTFVAATGNTGNTAQCVQRIDIIDTTPPQLFDCPAEITVCQGDPLSFTLPLCSDACGNCTVACERSDGQPLDAPVESDAVTITCAPTDECLNVGPSCDIPIVVSTTGPCFVVIPTVSEWGMAILALLMLIGGKVYFGRGYAARAR
jgi:hypothetical protein